MAKDPAFLFYPNDYMGGTLGMTFEEKGAYMDLLVLQFNKGAFTIDQAKKILNGSFEKLWPTISEKFIEQDGKFLNERLQLEKQKRAAHSKKQKENIGKRWYKSGKYQNDTKEIPLENENEIENKDIVETKDIGGEGEKGKFKIDPKMEIPPNLLELAEMNQWTLTNDRNTEFIKSQWATFLMERVHDPPGKKMQYRRLSDITSYFLNWIRNKHPNNGSHKQTSSGSNKKSGISSDRIEALKNF